MGRWSGEAGENLHLWSVSDYFCLSTSCPCLLELLPPVFTFYIRVQFWSSDPPKSMTSWKGELKNSYLLIFVVTLGFPIPCKVLPAVYKILFCSPIPCPEYPQNERGAYSFSCLWAFTFDLLEICLIFWLSLQECSLSVSVLWNPSMLFWDFEISMVLNLLLRK